MTILVDASALVAMTTQEPEARAFIEFMLSDDARLCCAIGIWEATLAIARKRSISVLIARKTVDGFISEFELGIASIGDVEARLAIDAHDRYGKGTGHPARLNMGDCFAHACAKTNGALLLYKGDEFAATDLAR